MKYISKKVMANSHYVGQINSHSFQEHPVKNHLADQIEEFDITGKHTDTIDFNVRGKFSDLAYCKALIAKFNSLSTSQLGEFVDYQLTLVENKKRWLTDLEKFTEINMQAFNSKRDSLATAISNIITDRLITLDNPRVYESKLIWRGKDTELLELVVALTKTNIVSNKAGKSSRAEVLAIFEEFFGVKVKDSEKKIEAAVKRKRDKAPFLKSLVEAFEQYAAEYEKRKASLIKASRTK